MKLTDYLRNKVSSKFNDLVKKDKCEICGSTEDLHVHHVYPFKDMINDTLEELGYKLKEVEEYTELELLNIKEKILGKHLYYSYKTLCADCHLSKVHKKYKEVDFSIDEDMLGKWLYKSDVVERVIVKNNMKDRHGVQITVNKLRIILPQYGYIIERKKFRDKEYYMETKKSRKITMYKIVYV